jgi:hypothetical protein
MDPRPGGTGVVTDVGQHGSEEWRGGGEGTHKGERCNGSRR